MIHAHLRADLRKLNKIDREIPLRVNSITKQAAEAVVNDIRSSWSPISPSLPGNPPAVVTGRLDRSIEAIPSGRDVLGRFAGKDSTGWSVRAGMPDAPHAGILEPPGSLNRPYFEPALERMAKQFPVLFNRLFDKL